MKLNDEQRELVDTIANAVKEALYLGIKDQGEELIEAGASAEELLSFVLNSLKGNNVQTEE